MGNKASKKQLKDSSFKWTTEKTIQVSVSGDNDNLKNVGKVYACDCRRIKQKKGDSVMIATATEKKGIIVTQMDVAKNKKGKTEVKSQETIAHTAMGWTMSVALSPSCTYLAYAGMQQIVYIEKQAILSGNIKKYLSHHQLQGHDAFISSVTFIEGGGYDKENLLLSASADRSIILWNIENGDRLFVMNQMAKEQILSLDHAYFDMRHMIVFGSADTNVYICDITDKIVKYQKKEQKNEDDNNLVGLVLADSFFKSDVNNVKFSPNGQLLAATSDDDGYQIFYKNVKYDATLGANKLKWTFLCKKAFDMVKDESDDAYGANIACLTWADDNTLIVGAPHTTYLHMTQIKEQRADKAFDKTVRNAVKKIIESLCNMNWTGFCEIVSNEILKFFTDYDEFDYNYEFCEQETRVCGMSSCEWTNGANVIVFGCFDGETRAVLQ